MVSPHKEAGVEIWAMVGGFSGGGNSKEARNPMVPTAIKTWSVMAHCAMRGPHAKTYTIFRSRLKDGMSSYPEGTTSHQNQYCALRLHMTACAGYS